MPVRRQNLEEWFTDHQLQALHRNHFHIPAHLDFDVSKLVAAYAEQDRRLPITAVMVKAMALLAKKHPEVNRTIFRTFLGTWVVEFDHIDVNVPVMIEHEGRRVLSATVVKDADTKTVAQINDEVKVASQRNLADLPIGSHFIANRNNLWNRTKLRLIHWAVWNLPWLYLSKRGGGMAVSSIVQPTAPGFQLRVVSRGPHVWTIGLWTLEADENGRHILRAGVGYDHSALGGEAFITTTHSLNGILNGDSGLDELL